MPLKTYEVTIVKTAVITVDADDEMMAFEIAEQTLNGEHGYCEYAGDGWEADIDLIEEVEPQ